MGGVAIGTSLRECVIGVLRANATRDTCLLQGINTLDKVSTCPDQRPEHEKRSGPRPELNKLQQERLQMQKKVLDLGN